MPLVGFEWNGDEVFERVRAAAEAEYDRVRATAEAEYATALLAVLERAEAGTKW